MDGVLLTDLRVGRSATGPDGRARPARGDARAAGTGQRHIAVGSVSVDDVRRRARGRRDLVARGHRRIAHVTGPARVPARAASPRRLGGRARRRGPAARPVRPHRLQSPGRARARPSSCSARIARRRRSSSPTTSWRSPAWPHCSASARSCPTTSPSPASTTPNWRSTCIPRSRPSARTSSGWGERRDGAVLDGRRRSRAAHSRTRPDARWSPERPSPRHRPPRKEHPR